MAALLLAFVAFLSLGLPDALLSVAWPGVRRSFGLSQSDIAWVVLSGSAGYLASTFFAGPIIRRWGTGRILAASTTLAALSLAGFAAAPLWSVFVACAAGMGLGSGAIDSAMNGYAARRFTGRQVSWMHAFFSLGAAVGPWLVTAVLVYGHSWRSGYGWMAGILGGLAILFACGQRAWSEDSGVRANESHSTLIYRALRIPAVWLQMGLFFACVGVELTLGQWNFTVNVESRGLAVELAGFCSGLFWICHMVGRFAIGIVIDRIGFRNTNRLAMLSALAGVMLFSFGRGPLSLVGLMIAALSVAPVFPTLVAGTPERVGKCHSAEAIGFSMGASLLGGSGMSALAGWLADHLGLESAGYLAVALCGALLILHETSVWVSKGRGARIDSRGNSP
ncbi:MAG: MFS transporter [Verrucomicrobiae bacterium]|nr:MFS transporter [Verrucomicrobiae bacterium]